MKKSDWTRKMLQEAILENYELKDPFVVIEASNKEMCNLVCRVQTESYAEGVNWFGNSVYEEMDKIIKGVVEFDNTSITKEEVISFLKEKEERFALLDAEEEKENI